MKLPFPGMDPYLETPELWTDVHDSLIPMIRNHLGPLLAPRYFVAIEERIYVSDSDGLALLGRADVAVEPARRGGRVALAEVRSETARTLAVEIPVPDTAHETYLEIRAAGSGKLVTAIEILSPDNKLPGKGRRLYLRKRRKVLGSRTHLVEIDLLRGGPRMPVFRADAAYDYSILVSRSDRRPKADLVVLEAIPKPSRRPAGAVLGPGFGIASSASAIPSRGSCCLSRARRRAPRSTSVGSSPPSTKRPPITYGSTTAPNRSRHSPSRIATGRTRRSSRQDCGRRRERPRRRARAPRRPRTGSP